MVLFSDFSMVRDDTQIQESFLNSLQEYDFAVKPLMEASIGPAGVSTQSRPSFSTRDGSFSIAINSDKATFEFVYTNINVSNALSIADFLEKVFDVGNRVSLFSDRLFRRAGLIRYSLFDEIDVNQVYRLFSNHIRFYDDLEMKDWSFFFPAKKIISSGREINATSRVSHVTTIIRKESNNQPFNGVSLVTDVNTLASNVVDNIAWEDMKAIIRDLQRIEYDITNQTANAIRGISI